MSGAHILVVDDNPANLKLVSYVLALKGFEVQVASDVPEARASIERDHPALILMDLQLPGIDGLTFTKALRADPRTESLLIVAFTAYAMRGDEERALAAGCDGYLTKPIDTRTFATSVNEFLEKGRQRSK